MKEDIPVIISGIVAGITAYLDISDLTRALSVIMIFLAGWYINKRIKEKKLQIIKELTKDISENPAYIDTKSVKEKAPPELISLLESIEKLIKKTQELEIQKTELDYLHQKIKRDEDLLKEHLNCKSEIEKIKNKVEYLKIIYDITSKISSNLDLKILLDSIAKIIGEKLKVEKFAILMKENDFLVVKATYGFPRNIKGLKFALTEGISGLAFSTKETIYIPDTMRDKRYLHWKGEFLEEGSFLSIPIKYRDETIGVFNFNKAKIGGFSPDEIELLEKIAEQSAIAIKNSQFFEEIKKLYETEQSTGLLTRQTMIRKIESFIKNGQKFAFALFDIDEFRSINLKYGYNIGDKAIVEIAKILNQEVREIDLVSRFGGDEFAIVFTGASRTQAIKDMAKISQLIGSITIETKNGVIPEKLRISCGISEFPAEGETPELIFEKADRKLLTAKLSGGGRIISEP